MKLPQCPEGPTFWNGELTPCTRGTAVVHGERIDVVIVQYFGDTFYLDNQAGTGWCKVTCGHGSPSYGHRNVFPEAGSFLTGDAA